MTNTELFAPIVDAIQPAFIYDDHGGEVKIYFSYSSFNKWQPGDKVKVIITDPNKTSMWGDNLIAEYSDISIPGMTLKDEKRKISLIIPPMKMIVNQYYQVQLTIVRGSQESPISQVTLIRPIPATSAVIIEQLTFTLTENPSLDNISGYITYSDGSKYEYIKDYFIEIKKSKDNTIIHTTPMIKNTLGTRFEYSLPKIRYEKDEKYILTFTYFTINGYKNTITREFQYTGTEALETDGPIFSSRANHAKGCLELTFDWSNSKAYREGSLIEASFELYKSSQEDNYLNWIKLTSSNITLKGVSNSDGKLIWEDYQINSGVNYHYKVVFNGTAYGSYQVTESDKTVIIPYSTSMDFEDIYLMDSRLLVPIRYNPKITGFKWVVQENITNTLGGVYPIIRRNADTYYKQFNLSATLDFHVPDGIEAQDSVTNNLEDFQHVFEEFTPICLSLNEGIDYQNNIKNFELPELSAKNYIMKFLTDGQIKLFRSAQEGTMLVHLSNISFTSNATLGRNIIDFSCTVTEVAPATPETLEKYDMFNRGLYEIYVYALDIDGFTKKDISNEIQEGIPYLPLEKLYNGTLVLTRSKVGEQYVV